jgi:hypothetical protein
VHVDDAGRQRQPTGVDRLRAITLDLADRFDAAVLDRDIRTARCIAEAVDDRCTADH